MISCSDNVLNILAECSLGLSALIPSVEGDSSLMADYERVQSLLHSMMFKRVCIIDSKYGKNCKAFD